MTQLVLKLHFILKKLIILFKYHFIEKKYRFDNISLKQKISGKIHINNFNAFIFAVN